MSAMTDRDRAVAEKLGWGLDYKFSHYLWRDGMGRTQSSLRFCSAATWETEWMVIEGIKQQRDYDFFEKVLVRLAENLKIDSSNGKIALSEYVLRIEKGDWANALADVIMEEQDV